MLIGVWTIGFELRYLPYGWARPDENPRRLDGWFNLPLFELGKKIWSLFEHWEWSGRATESSKQMQAGAVRSFSIQRKVWTEIQVVRTNDALDWCASGRYDTSSGRLELWTAGRPDGMTRRPDGWQGTEFFNLQTLHNLLKHFWIVESLLKSIFTYKWFCPIRM
jgi:hypothetical protein